MLEYALSKNITAACFACFLAVRHCFDTMMFRLVWGQAVHAMGVVLEHAETDAVARAALDGLRTATRWVTGAA